MSTPLNPNSAPEPDFDALYRDVILDHYREPHGRAPIARTDAKAEGMNPLCGDEVDVALAVGKDGRVEALQVAGRGCAISVASGSILHDLVVGATVPEARRILAAVKAVLQGAPLPADPNLGDFDALEGVQKFPVRIKCALLPWTTLDEALGDWERTKKAGAAMSESVDSHSGGPAKAGAPNPHADMTVSDGAEVKLAPGEKLTPQHVLDALKPVKDPEIFLSIVDLGLIYGVDVSEDGSKCVVRMTLTGPGCPVGPQILAAVHNTVSKIPCVKEPDVQLVWDPPWNPVIHASDEAKDALGIW